MTHQINEVHFAEESIELRPAEIVWSRYNAVMNVKLSQVDIYYYTPSSLDNLYFEVSITYYTVIFDGRVRVEFRLRYICNQNMKSIHECWNSGDHDLEVIVVELKSWSNIGVGNGRYRCELVLHGSFVLHSIVGNNSKLAGVIFVGNQGVGPFMQGRCLLQFLHWLPLKRRFRWRW